MSDQICTSQKELDAYYLTQQLEGEYPSATPEFLLETIDLVMGWAKEPESARLRTRLQGVLVGAYPTFQEPTRQQIIKAFVSRLDGNRLAILQDCFRVFIRHRYSPLAPRPNSKGKVLFLARRPYFQILREALFLREAGFQTTLVSMTRIPDQLQEVFSRSFDQVVRIPEHLSALPGVMERFDPDIVHIQCWMWDYALARVVLAHRGRARCVCEFYDLTSMMAERDVLASHWAPELVDLDLQSEGILCREADAIVCRFPQEVAEELRVRHGGLTRYLEMHPYACPGLVPPGPEFTPAPDGVPRLVYAGSLVPDDGACPANLFPEIHMRSVFEALLQQGLALDTLMDPQRPLNLETPGYNGYATLARNYSRFNFRNGVAPDQLARLLRGYDFGLVNLSRFDLKILQVRPSLMKNAVGTKLFTYLEAELPVIVNTEYEYMASIVSTYGLGLTVHTSMMATLPEQILAFDRAKAVANIRAFNAEHGMAQEIRRLVSLYDKLLCS